MTTVVVGFFHNGKELTRTFTFALAVGLLAWSDSGSYAKGHWKWSNINRRLSDVIIHHMTDTAQPKHATDRNIGEVSFRTGLTAARINVVCCWTSYFWILLCSAILDELGNVSSMFVPFPLFYVWQKEKGSHLSISHPKNFRTRQLDMPGYKGFSFWLVLLFSKEHGVGCLSFPKFFLPWYVCFWRNSSSLTHNGLFLEDQRF